MLLPEKLGDRNWWKEMVLFKADSEEHSLPHLSRFSVSNLQGDGCVEGLYETQ
jgi:hypothetical protein